MLRVIGHHQEFLSGLEYGVPAEWEGFWTDREIEVENSLPGRVVKLAPGHNPSTLKGERKPESASLSNDK